MVAVVSLFSQLHRPCSPSMAQSHTSLLGQLYSGAVLTRASLQPTLMRRYDSLITAFNRFLQTHT